ncbi:MAG TPA: DUF2721 domain-containing protein [Gemmatimonadales bacterium]|nr:DUF2721 domain-containing protein [Gemmatimonadales bacterium]
MEQESSLTTIAHVIQLAVAPVFLISGVGALLAVLTNRLARIIDRARQLDALGPPTPEVRGELTVLTDRATYINRSIALVTSSALLIATLIVVLFLGAFLTLNVARAVGVLFVGAMIALIVGLVTFLQEVRLATRTLRLHSHQ